jgi:hypothetical protein
MPNLSVSNCLAALAISLCLASCSSILQSEEEKKMRAIIIDNVADPDSLSFSDFAKLDRAAYLSSYRDAVAAQEYDTMQQVFAMNPNTASVLPKMFEADVKKRVGWEAVRIEGMAYEYFKIAYRFQNREGKMTSMRSVCKAVKGKFTCLNAGLPPKM